MHLCISLSGHSVRSGPACRLNLDPCRIPSAAEVSSPHVAIACRLSFWSLPCSLQLQLGEVDATVNACSIVNKYHLRASDRWTADGGAITLGQPRQTSQSLTWGAGACRPQYARTVAACDHTTERCPPPGDVHGQPSGGGSALQTEGSATPSRLAGEPRSTGLSWRLWTELKDTAWQELHHALIRGIAHGTLSR